MSTARFRQTLRSAGGWRRHLPLIVFGTLILLAVVGVTLTWRWFISPATTSVPEGDAVVVFAGGKGERLERALELMDAGVAEALVLSQGDGRDSEVGALCRDVASQSFHLVCLVAAPDSTVGEAAAFAAVAESRGWDRLVAVTSRTHIQRAATWLGRCHGGDVQRVAADEALRSRVMVKEWLAYSHGLIVDRSCPVADYRITADHAT